MAAANGLLTFLVPGVLRGTAVMNGSGRGTALAVLLLGVPVLWIAVQMLVLQRYFIMQPAIAAAGAAELLARLRQRTQAAPGGSSATLARRPAHWPSVLGSHMRE